MKIDWTIVISVVIALFVVGFISAILAGAVRREA